MGRTTTCYTACCGSRSDVSNPILVEIGFKEFHLPVPGRLLQGRPDTVTVGHNTSRCDIENVAYCVDYVFEAAEQFGLEVVPTDPASLHAEADRMGAF